MVGGRTLLGTPKAALIWGNVPGYLPTYWLFHYIRVYYPRHFKWVVWPWRILSLHFESLVLITEVRDAPVIPPQECCMPIWRMGGIRWVTDYFEVYGVFSKRTKQSSEDYNQGLWCMLDWHDPSMSTEEDISQVKTPKNVWYWLPL